MAEFGLKFQSKRVFRTGTGISLASSLAGSVLEFASVDCMHLNSTMLALNPGLPASRAVGDKLLLLIAL